MGNSCDRDSPGHSYGRNPMTGTRQGVVWAYPATGSRQGLVWVFLPKDNAHQSNDRGMSKKQENVRVTTGDTSEAKTLKYQGKIMGSNKINEPLVHRDIRDSR